MAASSPLPPHVEAYIEISLRTFATFSCCRGNRVFRLDLRLLEERIANTVADGLSLCLTAEKAFELLYSLKNSEGNVVHSSPMQLISQYSGVLPGVDWSADSYVVSVQIPALIFRELINNLSTHAPTVQATMTSLEIIFRAADMETVMSEEDLSYIILLREGQYPYTFRFTLHQKSAILNAVSLSDRVTLNQLLDSRTVIQIPVEGLGSIQFCFPL
ncbi:PREDICTED: uncharacterized protein LOC101308707 [Fragaria vesca subsp. vesca]|uniref:uncharacterized protein LOC101308707 n=1 Tax=Fragaria vesca subsp. vesca TaxID=101020 RepID=UPI0002C322A5|nr:PREDICTED: uncharacterized protein LOC101308707 [Fragaria vesca subsp. vesca]